MTVTEPNELVIHFRGVRGSLPTPSPAAMRYGGNTSCLEVRYRDELLILDAGSGVRALGDELIATAGADPVRATLLLSHAHWDHIQGLPFFAPAYGPHNHVRILAGPGRGEELQRALANQMSSPHFPVTLEQMRGLGLVEELSRGACEVGHFKICSAQLNHPGGCTGFRVQAGGSSFAYLPDHEPYGTNGHQNQINLFAYRGLVEFLRGVDLLILDTQYTAEEYENRVGWGHGSLPESVALALEAGVRRLLLFHHDPSHDDAQIDDMVEAGRRMAAGSTLKLEAASENKAIRLAGQTNDAVPGIIFPSRLARPLPQKNPGEPQILAEPATAKALGML